MYADSFNHVIRPTSARRYCDPRCMLADVFNHRCVFIGSLRCFAAYLENSSNAAPSGDGIW